jgi:hypothetical protein
LLSQDDLVQEAAKIGMKLVPIGNEGVQSEPLEWTLVYPSSRPGPVMMRADMGTGFLYVLATDREATRWDSPVFIPKELT